MNRSNQRTEAGAGLWLLVLILATAAIYLSGLHIWYFGDDFQYLYENPATRIFYYFFNRNLYHGFYRPVNSSIIAMVQVMFGWETWPIHAINILVHALLAWLVYLLMMRERFTRWQALLGSAFMVFSQANAGAVLSNDTFSQISGTFFGCLTLWILYLGFFRNAGYERSPNDPLPLGYYLLSLPAFVICLLSKETSVSFLPMVGVFFLLKNWQVPRWGNRLFRTAIEVFPYFLLTLLYVVARAQIGLSQPSVSSGTYGFSFGFNIIRNFAQFLFAAVVPASSATTFVAITNRQIGLLVAIGIGVLIFVTKIGYGLWRSGRHRVYLAMGLFALIGLFPAMVMNHVGELYLYNSMPFICVFVGAALGTLLERARGSVAGRVAFGVLLVALIASHVIAIQTKAASMRTNGDRARTMLSELIPYMARVPAHGQLLLLNPPGGPPEYSVFLMNGFSVFKWGEHVVWQQAKRPDAEVHVIEQSDMNGAIDSTRSLILTLKGDSIVVYREAGMGEDRR